MKGIDTLIKLHKRTLDELRRALVAIENQKVQLQELSAKLTADLKRELQLASTQPEMARFYGGFSKRIQERQDDIAAEIRKLDKTRDEVNDKIMEAFTELKKFEIAKENSRQRVLEETRRKEGIAMDEIASQQHHRKKDTTT